MAKPRILIVTDDASLRATLARWLLGAGYAVELAESPRRAREVMSNETLNLAIMDPHGMDAAGAELAREIAERTKHAIFIAQPTKEGTVSSEPSVQSGARLLWPFSEQDLLDRVRSELESTPTVSAQNGPQFLRFEGYTLDAAARSCLDANGQEVTLTRAEFSLLLAFARQPGRVLSRDELTHVVAGRGAEPDDRSVDVLISRLRRKIEPDPKAPRMIVTMPGEGYKFIARPQVVATDPASAAPSAVAAIAEIKEPLSGSSPALPAMTNGIAHQQAPRSARTPRALIPAVVIVAMAVLGWEVWSHRTAVPQASDATPRMTAPDSRPSQPGTSADQRAAVFKRMVTALQDDRFTWRTIERLAIESGVDEAEAHEILAEHPGEVVLGKSHDGKLIARLSDR